MIWHLLAGWYAAIWPNLAASGLCVGAAYLKLAARAERHHLEQLAHQKDLHAKIIGHLTGVAVPPQATRHRP